MFRSLARLDDALLEGMVDLRAGEMPCQASMQRAGTSLRANLRSDSHFR